MYKQDRKISWKKKRRETPERREKDRKIFFLVFLFFQFLTWLAIIENFHLFARRPYHCFIPLFAGRIFHAHAKKTHAENVCTRIRSTRLPQWRFLAPLCPSFSLSPSSLTPSHLSSSITLSPLLSYSLSFSFLHAQVSPFFLLSLLSHDDTPLRPSLTPASSRRLFTRTQDEIVKSVLHYSTQIFNVDLYTFWCQFLLYCYILLQYIFTSFCSYNSILLHNMQFMTLCQHKHISTSTLENFSLAQC